MLISRIATNNFNSSHQLPKKDMKKTVFKGASSVSLPQKGSKIFKPLKDRYDTFTHYIAIVLGKMIDNKFAVNALKKLGEIKEGNLLAHLIVLGSTILSGFYIKKTLENKDLDAKRRKTLAINQAAVWALSTVSAYTIDGLIKKKFSTFVDKFMAANSHFNNDVIEIERYKKGLSQARTAIVMGFVYRFLAPVVVTPIANAIGNKVNEKHSAHK